MCRPSRPSWASATPCPKLSINRRISSVSSFYKYLGGAAAELRLPITVPNPAHAQFISRESAAVGSKPAGPYDWGKPHPEAGAALKAASNSGPDSEKDKAMALPEHVKAEADAVVNKTGAARMAVQYMGETKGADAYDTKAMEAQRERQREEAVKDKAPAPEQPSPEK